MTRLRPAHRVAASNKRTGVGEQIGVVCKYAVEDSYRLPGTLHFYRVKAAAVVTLDIPVMSKYHQRCGCDNEPIRRYALHFAPGVPAVGRRQELN